MNANKLAAEILENIGGKENVTSATHCMTRLRLFLKDESRADDAKLKAIDGVISVVNAGGQKQIVIGPGVDQVYDEFCTLSGAEKLAAVDEAADEAPKEKKDFKGIVNDILAAISGCIIPILPVFMVAGIFKMVSTIFGPRNLGILSDTSQIYILCELVNAACFYFLPFFAAYTSSKKFKCNPIYAMILVAILVHPDMLSIVEAGEAFRVYGLIPMKLVNYTQAVLPVILMTWVLSKVEAWVKKIMPSMLRTLGVPLLTIFIMIPVAFCVLGPVCYTFMGWVADLVIWLNNTVGIFAIIFVAIFWQFIIMFGMHMPIMMALLPVWLEMGYDAVVSPAGLAIAFAGLAVELGYALRASSSEAKQLGWTCFIANFTANVSEPYVYGIYMQDKKALAWHTAGAVAGSIVMYILGAKVTMFSGVGFPIMNFVRFGEYAIQGSIGMAVAFIVSFALSFIFGFEKKKVEIPE